MVKNKKIDNKKLYENMILSEKKAHKSQDNLLDAIKKWFSKVISKESADYTKIILGYGGYIQVRTIEKIDDEILQNFQEEFDFMPVWVKKENMTDFRNIETISVDIYEYAFIPKNVKELLGDNQVEFGEDGVN